jgi:hypothetical protein
MYTVDKMTLIIIPLIVALVVGGPAWGTPDESIFLHCETHKYGNAM